MSFLSDDEGVASSFAVSIRWKFLFNKPTIEHLGAQQSVVSPPVLISFSSLEQRQVGRTNARNNQIKTQREIVRSDEWS